MSNSITATGRLVRDSELRYLSSGDAILNFTLASDVGFGDKKVTNFFQCSLWGKRGESIAEYLTKGVAVTVFVSFTLREYDHNGTKKSSPDIRVNEIDMHRSGGTQKQESSEPVKYERKKPPVDDIDDDQIPF